MATEKKKPSLPFTVNGKITEPFWFRTVSHNFNDVVFQEDDGYGKVDFARRVDVLARLAKHWVEKDGVSLINLQEISGRFMKGEEIRYRLLKNLPAGWTATGLIPRHGDAERCLSLMTLWNANVLHLDTLQNFHFSEHADGLAGDGLALEDGIQATSNALIMKFSPMVPENATTPVAAKSTTSSSSTGTMEDVPIAEDIADKLHRGGRSIDITKAIVNVNVHLPLAGPLKVKCLDQLHERLNEYVDNEYADMLIHMTGDMNVFANEEQAKEMVRQLHVLGHVTCCMNLHKLGAKSKYGYKSYDGKRERTTTFIGTVHDLKNIMKLLDADADKVKYGVWCRGDADEIKKTFGLDVLPLDWVVVSQPGGWKSDSIVFDMDDIEEMEEEHFTPWRKSFGALQNLDLDLGNYLSDHLPIMTTLRWGIPDLVPYKKLNSGKKPLKEVKKSTN